LVALRSVRWVFMILAYRDKKVVGVFVPPCVFVNTSIQLKLVEKLDDNLGTPKVSIVDKKTKSSRSKIS
jgi:hypothetical protein